VAKISVRLHQAGFLMITLRDRLAAEISAGGPAAEWFELIQPLMKSIAGKWPQDYFTDIDLDAKSDNWKFADKLDLTMKYYEEEIKSKKRKAVAFILTATSDKQIKSYTSLSITQFLAELTKGVPTKRVFKLIETRLLKLGQKVLSSEEDASLGGTILENHEGGQVVKGILLRCKKRLPNAFAPAGEGERDSPIWSPSGYDEMVSEIVLKVTPVTEDKLRSGISGALAHLQLALYLDDVEQANPTLYGKLVKDDSYNPFDVAAENEERAWAKQVMARLSPGSTIMFQHVSSTKYFTELAELLGVHRNKATEMAHAMRDEINQIWDDLAIPKDSRSNVLSEMRQLVFHQPLKSWAEKVTKLMPLELTNEFFDLSKSGRNAIYIHGESIMSGKLQAKVMPERIVDAIIVIMDNCGIDREIQASVMSEIQSLALAYSDSRKAKEGEENA
jgi:hypothetical protein